MKRLLVIVFPVLCLVVIAVSWAALEGHGKPATTPPALASTSPGPAATPSGPAATTGATGSPGFLGLGLRVGVALMLVLVLVVGAVYTLRLVSGRGGLRPGGPTEVLERSFIAPKRALYTVRLGERVMVLGVTETTITPVLEIDAGEAERLYPRRRPAGGTEPATGFREILGRVVRRQAQA